MMIENEEKIGESEPLETYHVYILKEEAAAIDSIPTNTKPPLYPLISLMLCSVLLVGTLLSIPGAPAIKQETLFHTFSLPHDLQSRVVPPVTMRQSITVASTGRGHEDATRVHGSITFYNGSFTQQDIPQNMIFTTANGVQIVTDTAVSIPSGNPPNYGVATVSAHALISGSGGNIPAYAIDDPCCFLSVKAVNTEAFSGGRNARDYHIVTKQDIDKGVTPYTQALYRQAQKALRAELLPDAAFIPLPCSSTVTANHRVGEEAKSVTLRVSETCSAIAYSLTSLQEKARELVHIPTGFILTKLSVHLISTTLTGNQKSATIVVSVTWNMVYNPPRKGTIK